MGIWKWQDERVSISHSASAPQEVERNGIIKKYISGPGWCGSVVEHWTVKQKGHRFDSQSGHMPGL